MSVRSEWFQHQGGQRQAGPPSLLVSQSSKLTNFQFHNHKGRHSTPIFGLCTPAHRTHVCTRHTTHTHMCNTHTKHTLGVKSVWKQATTGLHSLYDVSRPNHKQCVSLWIPSESTERIAGQWKAGDPTPSLKMKRKHAYFPPKQYLNCISRLVLLPCLDPCFAVNRPWDLRRLPQLDAFITRWLKGSEQKTSLNVGLPETKGNAYLKFVVE